MRGEPADDIFMALPLASTVLSARAIRRLGEISRSPPPPRPPPPLSLPAMQLAQYLSRILSGAPQAGQGWGWGDDLIFSPAHWLFPGFRNDIISAPASPPPLLPVPSWLGQPPSPAPHPRMPRCLGDHKFPTSLSEGIVIHYMSDTGEWGVKGAGREPRAGQLGGEVVDNKITHRNTFRA